MLPRLAACVLGAALLCGCGGGGEEPVGSEPQHESTGLTTFEVASAGFSVAVPHSWEAVTADASPESDSLEAVLEKAPTLQPSVEALREPGSVLKFVAFDPEVREEFATNFTVVVEQLAAGVTFEKYASTLITQLELVPVVVGDVERADLELPAGEAVRASYRLKLTAAGRTTIVSTLQYALVADRAAYTLTYTTLPDLAGDYEAAFEDSARAFRLLETR
jgi:hypothetical protein